ncbi:NAD(+) diphosphatase [Nannocystis bainbridge]|uniref:NAD(+) diphosphatase n=1 Tax=Nannocystis bainbridge TaxID=2995303 RepID=A0ABT5E051_9BACT|nr:NAD(+) diphosphatase [Nannocystis bainbridge]MDC0718081.1 NAD(+) diphosphatase [Nannocystis bainbridge]
MATSTRSRNNVFAALALDRASERRDDAGWIETRRTAETTRYAVVRPDGKALVDATRRGLRLLAEAERAAWLATAPLFYLGEAEQVAHFAVAHAGDDEEPLARELGGQWMDLRAAGLALPAFDAGLFAYARGLLHWQTRARFCGACGSPTIFVSAGHRARCTNPACRIEHFPRTDPAIIVIVGWGDACLLGRQASWPPGRFSTLAGFVEPGETLEDAVRREVFEESGVTVAECDYHSSQPWPFPASLMLGFTAEAQGPELQVGPELEAARWFTADEIVGSLADGSLVLPPPLSVSFRLIEHWLRETAGLELTTLARG